MANMQELLAALDVFSRVPDKAHIEQANNFLLEFQHSQEAWTTANALLMSTDAPVHARIFAAQTFRSKVTYDLHQLDERNLHVLRDTLLAALVKYQGGPKAISTQLCLALSGLALQLPTWSNAVQSVIDLFGANPASVPVLLKFLTLLPEEITMNSRIPITDEEYSTRSKTLIADNVDAVIQLLVVYIHATGVTLEVQDQVLRCLRSWLVSGHVAINKLAATPLFQCAFEALDSEPLFDAAVDALCEIIHETQEINESMSAIELILPRLVALRPRISAAGDDSDKVKGYARIFTEAGETYRQLITHHTETFFPLVEAVGECSAYSDLDVVQITFPFWMRLAGTISQRDDVSPLFTTAFQMLMSVMIKHLHFPDESQHSSQELDDFRSFRHNIGDTLKDCCTVLQTSACLAMVYDMIMDILSKGSAASWQDVEAPLFAIRAMGGELDPEHESPVIPKILELIPSLPPQPQIRYTAILIMARYTAWTARHPEFIQPQLQYISTGFTESNEEIVGASVMALQYICRDCKQHLTDFLPTLHNFLRTSGSKLSQEHKREVYEAIGHVISAMPMNQAAESMRTFAQDLLGQVHSVSMSGSVTAENVRLSGEALENLETLLAIVEGFGEHLPPACQNTCQEGWQVLDLYLTNFGSDFGCSERTTRVLRRALTFFGSNSLIVAPSVATRMAVAFKASGQPGYMWIAGKIINQFGEEENPELRNTLQATYETMTYKMVELLQSSARDIAGALEDYVHVIMPLQERGPDILFTMPAFHSAFKCCMHALTVVYSDVIVAALDVFRDIFMHDCLDPHRSPQPPKFIAYASTIRQVMSREGQEFVLHLFNGIMGNFPQEAMSSVVTIFRFLCVAWPMDTLQWISTVLPQIPSNTLFDDAKTSFLNDVTRAVQAGQFHKIKSAVLSLDRAARKARERRRVDRFEM